MDKNFKNFLIKVVVLVAAIFITRFIFQFPVEYFHLSLFKQNALTRLFSKIDALQVLALVSIFFAFYFKERISNIAHPKINVKKSLLFLLQAELAVAVYYFIRASANYYNITGGLPLYIIWAGILLSLALAFFFFVVAVFSKDYLIKFYNVFTKELIGAALVSVALYKLLMLFQAQWLFFSRGASTLLFKALSLFYPATLAFEGNTPVVGTNVFAIAIGAPCSGIDSMFLFTAFCAGLFALDHKRLKKGIFALSFVIGFIGVYAVNILRLFLLVLAGIYISPEFSVGLFHTNAGWILFIIYFLLFYLVIRKFIYVKGKDAVVKKK